MTTIKQQTIDAILEEVGLESIIPEHVSYRHSCLNRG
jgi:hypothetical protein